MNLENQVNSIVKFVEEMYSPSHVHVESEGVDEYVIIFYFDEIDNEYITNPLHRDLKLHKASRLKREIRTQIYNFFGIKTTGLPLTDHFSPVENHPMTILVSHTSEKS